MIMRLVIYFVTVMIVRMTDTEMMILDVPKKEKLVVLLSSLLHD